MIQDTSLFAYKTATQHLGAKQKAVMNALRFFPDATNAELAAHLNWPVNRVTPRVLELRKMGLILEGVRRTCYRDRRNRSCLESQASGVAASIH